MVETCECGNEPSGCIKCGELFWLAETRIVLKKDCVPWSKYEELALIKVRIFRMCTDTRHFSP